MEQCFKCKILFSSSKLIKKKSGKSYCSVCVLYSLYRCENCGRKFLLGDFAAYYKEAKEAA